MKSQTLAAAFRTALERTNPDRRADSASPREDLLLAALQRSATGMDAIVQRRIGLAVEDASSAPR